MRGTLNHYIRMFNTLTDPLRRAAREAESETVMHYEDASDLVYDWLKPEPTREEERTILAAMRSLADDNGDIVLK